MLEGEREYYSKMNTNYLKAWLVKRQGDLFIIGHDIQAKKIASIDVLSEGRRRSATIKIEELVIVAEELVKRGIRIRLDTTRYPKAINDVLFEKIGKSKLLKPLTLPAPKQKAFKPKTSKMRKNKMR